MMQTLISKEATYSEGIDALISLITTWKKNAIRKKINCDIDIEYAIKALKYNNGWVLLYDWH